MCIFPHVCIRTCLFAFVGWYIGMSVHVWACMYISILCICVRVHACICLSVFVCNVHMTTIHNDIIHSDPIQVKLLQSLGLRSTLITDGSQAVNLFTTAQGLLGAIGSGPSKKISHIYTEKNVILY